MLQYPRLPLPCVAFRNRGDLTFENVSATWGFNTVGYSQGMAAADLDNDGFINTKELGSYLEDEVPLLAEKVFKHKQYPIVNDTGQGFPVVRVK